MSTGLGAQIFIEGQVQDSETDEPLSFAHIIVKGTENGSITNDDGHFRIGVEELPAVLVFSEVAHQSKMVRVLDTSRLTVSLDPFQFELRDVVISEEGEDYFKIANQVLDFEFYDDKILLLGNSGREVRLITHRGDVVERTLTPDKFGEVFKDCLGNLHVVNDEEAYQVFYDYEGIRFIHPHPREIFERYLRNCECRYKEGLIYSMGRKRGLVTTFLYARGGSTMPFYELGDTAALNYLEGEFDVDYFIEKRNQGDKRYAMSVSELKENLEGLQNTLPVDWLDSRIIHPSAYYVFPTGKELRVFSLGIMTEFRFSDLTAKPEKQICKIRNEDLDYLFKDDVSGDIYAVYRTSMGRVRVDHVDDHEHSLALKKYAFPSEVKVHNDHVFFINDPAIDGSNYLFRKNRKFGETAESW